MALTIGLKHIAWAQKCIRGFATATPAKLRRSYLYVPSSSQRMLDKSKTTSSDVIIYDLEDSVTVAEKDAARTRLQRFLQEEDPALPHPDRIAVRINSITTPFFHMDLETAVGLPSVRTLVLPKISSAKDLDYVLHAIQGLNRPTELQPLHMIASIESAKSLWNIGHIAQWTSSLNINISALLFAAEDYCADTSIIRTPSRRELLYTRSQVVSAAKAFGLNAIDMVCINYQDVDYLREECQDGRQLGFDGKQAIHPKQVEIIQSTFVPSEQEIMRAIKIVGTMETSTAGAFGLDRAGGGKEMIDAPMLKQAERTLAIATAAGLEIPTFNNSG